MAKEIPITVSLPARLHARLRCSAANAGLSIETAILHCVEQNVLLVDAARPPLNVVTQPAPLWADQWNSRWGELNATPCGRPASAAAPRD